MAGLIPGKPQLRVEGTYINGYIYLQVNEQKLHTNYTCMHCLSLKFFSTEDVNCRVMLQVRISYYVTQCHTNIELNLYLPHKNKFT